MDAPTTARDALARLVDAAHRGALDDVCEDHGVRVLSAFGSATRPSYPGTPGDLDVGVSFLDTTQSRALGLWDALVDLTGYEGVDLVVIDVDDPVLRSEALTGIPLYEHQRGAFGEAQIAALGERRDTAHLRRLNLELMAR